MYAGGFLATLLLLGMVLLVVLMAAIISEPRDAKAPRTREEPGDITRRLRPQAARGSRRVKSGGGAKG